MCSSCQNLDDADRHERPEPARYCDACGAERDDRVFMIKDSNPYAAAMFLCEKCFEAEEVAA